MSAKRKKPGFFQKFFGSSALQYDEHSPCDEHATTESLSCSLKTDTHSAFRESTSTSALHRDPSNIPPNVNSHSESAEIETFAGSSSSQRHNTYPQLTRQTKRRNLKHLSAAMGGLVLPVGLAVAGGEASIGCEHVSDSCSVSSCSSGGARRNRRRSSAGGVKWNYATVPKADVTHPLEFPASPELILSHHKALPFLSHEEEWLLVELNEYECLVASVDVLRTAARHAQFYEVDPGELWEEFFAFVEQLSWYDEVISEDVWREFRAEKYFC